MSFSRQYLEQLASRTGFPIESLQKQMALLDILRELSRHPRLGKAYVLKGGTAINLFFFELPRLSVDIDLNYIGSPDRQTMIDERPNLEQEMKKLVESRGIAVKSFPSDHAGGKWRLQAPSAFGGSFSLELDLNYLMRVPVFGVQPRSPFPLDEDYIFEPQIVSFEELFAGKIKALLDRSAPRDLYDVFRLSDSGFQLNIPNLRKNVILFGITCDDDWRRKDFGTIDRIDQQTVDEQLAPMLRAGDTIDLESMKMAVKRFLTRLLDYNDDERQFMYRFLDEGVYDPALLFADQEQVKRLEKHPAVLWKLQNHRQFLGLDEKK